MRKPPVHRSFLNAFRGIFLMMKHERNFQIELAAFIINLLLAVYFHLPEMEALLVLTISFGVLSAEMFNTAIEKICDFIQPDFDRRIGFIKDVSAGAVLLMAIASVVTGVSVYWKYVFP